MPIRTSVTDPLYVDWISGLPFRGKYGVTLAPGKHQDRLYSAGRWERDLAADLERLRGRVDVLVCLLEEHELTSLNIPDYMEATRTRGFRVYRLPIRDGDVPPDTDAVARLLAAIEGHLRAGENVVVHCAGGLGRAGTITGCLLVQNGKSPDEALAILARERDPNSPEHGVQKAFIRAWAGRPRPERLGRPAGALGLLAALGRLADAPGNPRALAAEQLRRVEREVAADPGAAFRFDARGYATLEADGQRWAAGRFEQVSIEELRRRVPRSGHTVRYSVLKGPHPLADIGALQAAAGPGSLFQVASQFNGLEAPGAHIVPIARYVHDNTQGPRASVSAFPGTFLRHYAAPGPEGRFVQGPGGRLDFLGEALDPAIGQVRDGYLMASGIARPEALAGHLEERFGKLCVGLHDGVEVALGGGWGGPVPEPRPRIGQVLTSSLALGGYSASSPALRAACRPLLRAAYLGTLLGAISLGRRTVVLTLIGGGVFGNPHEEIHAAIAWALAEADGCAPAGFEVILNLWQGGDSPADAEARRRGGAVLDLAQL